ncbi:MAG: DUF1501 domain-containing protein [Planctomycetota bacterium]
MDDNLESLINRRSFLRKGACASLGMAGLASQVFTLRTAQALLADTGGFNDYKAAVCVFLFGGNDSGNMLVPWDGGPENFADYQTARTTLALTQDQAAGQVIAPPGVGGRRFAFHPAMSDVAGLFNAGHASVVANVGTLVEPVTRDGYLNKSANLPPQLFAHNIQQEQWQVSTADAVDRVGWGGRVADVIQSCGANADSPVSMNISLAGTNFFLSGRTVTPYVGSADPSIGVNANFGNVQDKEILAAAYAEVLAISRSPRFAARNHLAQAYSDVAESAVIGAEAITAALDAPTSITTPTPENGLSQQLAGVAKLIEQGQSILGQTRQIFFVAIGGFDNHDRLIGTDATDGEHASRLGEVNSGLAYFWNALGEIGMRDNVTTFTASDFGRTYRSNGDGSDHAWGAEHLIMGGSQVNGGRLFGTYPTILPDGPDDAGSNGRFIPTTSVDQYAFEIARWMGVPISEMTTVFPNLTRFLEPTDPSTHLGILI